MGCLHCKFGTPQNLDARIQRGQPSLARDLLAELADAHPEHSCAESAAGAPDAPAKLKSLHYLRPLLNRSESIYTRYDLKDCVLGHGVSGVVRLAEQRETAEKYAIKTLSINVSNLKKAYMSRNEVDTYLQLDHPTIMRLVDVFEDAEKVYIVMEFSSGHELYDQLINEKFLDEYRAKKLILQMLECVVYCHNKRICHRDIKLENWVYSNQKLNLVKLIDFGFSRTFSSNVPMTAMHGTIYYVSPEVMDGCYREKCDIWSIGVILYMVLSGKPPFTGNADYQILLRIKNNLYDFKGPVWNKVSAEAKEFIKLLLQPSPAERPSAREALQHSWLRNVNIDNEILDGLPPAQVAARTGAALAALAYYAGAFAPLEKVVLYAMMLGQLATPWNHYLFRLFDDSRSGCIGPADFANVLARLQREHSAAAALDAAATFAALDFFHEGQVSYTAFICATDFVAVAAHGSYMRRVVDALCDADERVTEETLRNICGASIAFVPLSELLPDGAVGGAALLSALLAKVEQFEQASAPRANSDGTATC